MKKKTDLKSLSLPELIEVFEAIGEKKFRANQLYSWMHQKMILNLDEATNLSKKLIEKLKNEFDFTTVGLYTFQESMLDGTRKYLFELDDENVVESVFMKYHHGNSVCISSQIGCRMGCSFCASTLDGLARNLTTGEMLDQIYAISRHTGERISNVVIMGMGEPLDNYDNIVRFVKMISEDTGLNISQRNITVSTCGIAPMIEKLANEKFQITLALSLHATTDKKRQSLMPITNKYPIDVVLEACRYYFRTTGRRLTFEYSLVAGANDTEEDALELAALIKDFNCHVNLIPINPIKERDYKEPSTKNVRAFQNKLEKNGINATIRREMGRDIDGACGQLRRKHTQKSI